VAIPSFNGVFIFGRAVKTIRAVNPRDEQRVSAPGVEGVVVVDLGHRGRVTKVQGLLVGVNAPALNLAQSLFESYVDGRLYILVDSYSNIWPYVKLMRFEPASHPRFDAWYGYILPYSAEFQHLR
jgi:hypothetical protein